MLRYGALIVLLAVAGLAWGQDPKAWDSFHHTEALTNPVTMEDGSRFTSVTMPYAVSIPAHHDIATLIRRVEALERRVQSLEATALHAVPFTQEELDLIGPILLSTVARPPTTATTSSRCAHHMRAVSLEYSPNGGPPALETCMECDAVSRNGGLWEPMSAGGLTATTGVER